VKFSLMFEAQMVDTSRANERKLFNDIVEQCVLADQLGYDGIWAVEHTALTQYAHMSAPETFLAFVAGKTKRIRIGHGVVCLPPAMNHPVKVAERIATLDILSNGRVDFGMGKGGTQQESGTFGYDINDLAPQIDEMMYLIPKILKDGFVEHDGKYVKIPRRPVHPSPVQEPHPPLYMACTRTDSLVTAGSRGIGALVMGFGGREEIFEKNKIYRDSFRNRKIEDQVGFRPTEHLAALCPTVVLKDRARARRLGVRAQRFLGESIRYWYAGGPQPIFLDENDATDDSAILARQREDFVAYLGEQMIPVTSEKIDQFQVNNDAYGDADDCLRQVRGLVDAGADEIMFMMNMGGISQDVMVESMRIIAEEVMPHFRDGSRSRDGLSRSVMRA
jgi:alkanesulfonate monooxygenase SsuD/methylene tetrahydromethanopterin reductase-like flavin-dependent oxidoreductase (luciferase family)